MIAFQNVRLTCASCALTIVDGRATHVAGCPLAARERGGVAPGSPSILTTVAPAPAGIFEGRGCAMTPADEQHDSLNHGWDTL